MSITRGHGLDQTRMYPQTRSVFFAIFCVEPIILHSQKDCLGYHQPLLQIRATSVLRWVEDAFDLSVPHPKTILNGALQSQCFVELERC